MARREALVRLVRLGLSAPVASLLASCVTRRHPPSPDERPMSAAGLLERELRIFNWSDYIDPGVLRDFERETAVRIRYDTYESNEEMIAKLVGGGGGYDLIGPSGYLVPVLAAGGLLQPLDHAVLTGWHHLAAEFLRPADGLDGKYAQPNLWGMTGVGYRADLVSTLPTSWGIFTDQALRGRMTMLADGREVLGAMLKWRGHSLNSRDRHELERARDDALAVKPNLRAYLSSLVQGQLISGDVAVAQTWSADARMAALEEPRIAFVVPAEGGTLYTDCLAIPRDAPNRRAAHAFLNYVLRPEVAARIADFTGAGSVNRDAVGLMRHPMATPDPALRARLEYMRDLGPDTDLWDRLWTEVRAG
jgi:spermidine/putrescine-binding protein